VLGTILNQMILNRDFKSKPLICDFDFEPAIDFDFDFDFKIILWMILIFDFEKSSQIISHLLKIK